MVTISPVRPSHTTSHETYSDELITIPGGRIDIGEYQFPEPDKAQSSALPDTFPAPHASQALVIAQAKRFNVANCGRRYGKTELGKRLLAESAIQGSRTAYLAPSYPMAHQFYREMLEACSGRSQGNEANRRIGFPSGGFIDIWSMEGGADRVRGQKYHRVVIDEAAMVLGLRHIWEKVVRPTLTDYRGDAWFLSTPRRGSDFEAFYRKSESDTEWQSWTLTTHDNPYIDRTEIEAAKAGLSAQAFAQEYLADFEASDSELVYPEFGKRHIGAPSALWSECKWRIAAIDPGGGDPTACYLIGVDKNEHINVYAPEFYRRGDVTPDMLVEFVSKADSVGKVQRITIGETGGNLVTNHFRRAGLPAVKADMAKGEGIEYVRWALQNNLVTVDPKCENMIAEFGMYRWAQKKDPYEGDRYATSIPGDRHGDAMDALRYGIAAIVGNLRGARPMVVEQARQQRAAVR
jgi:hypothetical protein